MRITITNWLLVCLAAATGSSAQDFRLESAGGRFGFSANRRTGTFKEAEAFANFNLPWSWDVASNWHLQTRLDLSAGWLTGRGDDGVIASLGPSVVVRRDRIPLSLEAGLSPTILSRDKFDGLDFSMPLQFTSHIGVNWDLGTHATLGYRYQHMSNAGLGAHNPGLNLHVFAVGYRF
jgi:hypothetical protein